MLLHPLTHAMDTLPERVARTLRLAVELLRAERQQARWDGAMRPRLEA